MLLMLARALDDIDGGGRGEVPSCAAGFVAEDPRFQNIHADGLGSIVATTDAAGNVTSRRQYDAWGNLEVGADQPGYAFTGREWDPETGLYYYRARYYDPKIGRFINEDPIGLAGGDVNLYGYVKNNPVAFVDPLGLLTELLTFSPAGHGRSSFGHTALNINGMTYSFGENGWWMERTSSYLARNNVFRDATGQVLNLTSAEEIALLEAIADSIAMHPRWTSTNNCTTEARDMLEQATYRPFWIGPRPPTIAPLDFSHMVDFLGYVISTNTYPKK